MDKYCGIPASSGIAVGTLALFNILEASVPRYTIDEGKIPLEISRFENALIRTRKDIINIQESISKGLGMEHADIFNAHLLVVEDRSLIEEVIKKIIEERLNVESAFSDILNKYKKVFSEMEDEYLRERVIDIKDVGRRVINTLIGKCDVLPVFKKPTILFAHDISPSDAAALNKEYVIAIATEVGSKTSHTTIMARSMGIPAIVGLGPIGSKLEKGAQAVVDGFKGVFIVAPDKATVASYKKRKLVLEKKALSYGDVKDKPTQTKDGYVIILSANLELTEELPHINASGAEGIGLYRTEYFYLNRVDLPNEEEQFAAYRKVVESVAPNPVIIRTLDLGGDKFLSNLQIPREMNPFLGWRAIRFCLALPDVFKVQLKAILRASVYGKVKIMYPLISSAGEVIAANSFLNRIMQECDTAGIAYDKDIEVGAMIEVPSAVITADHIADHVDFFSIGTNDLIQYSLAADRVNERVAYLYKPFHPSILRLLRRIISVGHSKGIWVGVCGEMAADPLAVILFIGLGIDELSMNYISIPAIKTLITKIDREEVKNLIPDIYKLTDERDIKKILAEYIHKAAPEFDVDIS